MTPQRKGGGDFWGGDVCKCGHPKTSHMRGYCQVRSCKKCNGFKAR